jgi:antitoxin component YwqK of YwqJK toxin-antitoxin module
MEEKTTYYPTGQINLEKWYYNGKLHREDGPAYILYYNNGKIQCKKWYLNDQLQDK